MKHVLQQLALTTPSLLRVYYRNGVLLCQDLKMRVFVRARQIKPLWADYRFKNYERMAFQQQHTETLVANSLFQLADTYLEMHDSEIRCRTDQFEAWQDCLTRVPPLPLLVAVVFQNKNFTADQERLFRQNFTKHSMLPSIFHPLLENLIQEEGLNELHIHLNGTTEFDLFWQDALAHSRKVYQKLATAFKITQQPVYELYAQIDPELTPSDVRVFLDAACRIRDLLVRHLFLGQPYPEELGPKQLFSESSPDSLLQQGGTHPLAVVATCKTWPAHTCEALMLLAVYRKMKDGDVPTTRLFHQYLLIQGLFNRLLVQQWDQVGFDQFQKITLNEIREFSEVRYLQRFRQLKGRYGNDLAYLEGRFAPKITGAKNLMLLKRIFDDYQRFLQEESSGSSSSHTQEPVMNQKTPHLINESSPFVLKLTAHLIKEKAPEARCPPNGRPNLAGYGSCRHAKLRHKLNLTTRRLANVVKRRWEGRNLVTGLDAAANELHTPPEVFAPAYRLFRRRGFLYFTYHAGEDYEHLVSGMRAIWEAATFLELGAGNRIGHATAIGIKPDLWLDRCGDATLPITRGEWLDNLVFASYLLGRNPDFNDRLPALRAEINQHAAIIYTANRGSSVVPDLENLTAAWQMRDLDGLLLADPGIDWKKRFFYRLCLDPDTRAEAKRCLNRQQAEPRAFALWQQYHCADVVERAGELIEVPIGFFSARELTAMQAGVINRLNEHSIALESMPTSNLLISYYQSYREHHLFRWLGLTDTESGLPEPIVVLASDNPGIFANNLRNDFSHVFLVMIGELGLSPNQAIEHLRKLNRNGRIFRFGQQQTNENAQPPLGLSTLLKRIT